MQLILKVMTNETWLRRYQFRLCSFVVTIGRFRRKNIAYFGHRKRASKFKKRSRFSHGIVLVYFGILKMDMKKNWNWQLFSSQLMSTKKILRGFWIVISVIQKEKYFTETMHFTLSKWFWRVSSKQSLSQSLGICLAEMRTCLLFRVNCAFNGDVKNSCRQWRC